MPGSSGALVCGMGPGEIDSALVGIDLERWTVTSEMNILSHWVQGDA